MRRRILVLASFLAAVIACHSPTSPPPPPTPTFVTSIKLDGPTRFAPTSSPKFTVTATMSDKTTQDYTSKVQWFAFSNTGPSPISISPSGALTIRSTGEAVIQTSYTGLRSSLSVMVIPDGTYRLTGAVNEAGLPVSQATVAVITGTGTGLTTTTDSQGAYRLYGVAGPVQVQVSKPGYDPVTNTATISSDNVLDFPNLSETGGPPALAGTYSLSIVAAGDCFTIGTPPLATPDRQRTYTAVVTESGPNLQVTLSGAPFRIQNGKGNQFTGRASPDHASFTLGDSGGYDYYYYKTVGSPDVVEQLPADASLSFWGTVDATVSSAGISGAFTGNIVTYSTTTMKLTESCASGHHQFTMTPLTSTTRRRR